MDYGKIAMCHDSEGNAVEFYYIPTKGGLQRCAFTSDPSYVMFTDGNGTFLYDIRTMGFVGRFNVASNVEVCQMSEQGYLAYPGNSSSDDNAAWVYDNCMIEPTVMFRRYDGEYENPMLFVGYGFIGGLFGAMVGNPDLIQPSFFNYKGKKVWKNGNQMRLVDREKDIVLCSKKRNDNDFVAYKMSTGDIMWERKISNNLLVELN